MMFPQCPLCRSPLGIAAGVEAADVAVSVMLLNLLEVVFPTECAERSAEVAADALELQEAQREQEARGGDATAATAATTTALVRLFVLDSMLPGQRMVLNVFEPRYLAMVEEVLREPGRRFGMVGSDAYRYRGHHHRPYAPLDHGVEVVIEQCVMRCNIINRYTGIAVLLCAGLFCFLPVVDRLPDWLASWLAGWLAGGLAGWWAGWLAGWQTGWLASRAQRVAHPPIPSSADR